jgi:hypothetical protein
MKRRDFFVVSIGFYPTSSIAERPLCARNGHSGSVLSSAPTMVFAKAACIRLWHPKLEVRAEHTARDLWVQTGDERWIDNPCTPVTFFRTP